MTKTSAIDDIGRRFDYAVIAALIMVAVMVGAQTAYLIVYVAGPITCQTQENQRFRDALTARTDAATQERAAQREFLRSATTGVDPDSLGRYLGALDSADRNRANNPLPQARC